MINKQPTWYLALIALPVLALDQLTKYLVRTNLDLYESWMPIHWLSPYVAITRVRNSGAAFGIFPAGSTIFFLIGIAVVVAILYYYHELPPAHWGIRTALGMQLGGAIGNLTDRIRFDGHVTDFIHVTSFPVFNLADSCITIGVVLLVVLMTLEERREANQQVEEDPDADLAHPVERPDSPAP